MPQTTVRLLAVDDSIPIVEDIKEMFELEDGPDFKYEVTVSYNGQDAVNKMQEFIPDLVILDIMMPILDGYGVLDYMRRTKATVQVPVVIVSALDDKSRIFEGFERGANDYITKPFAAEDLITRVQIQLVKSAERKRDQQVSQAASLQTSLAGPTIFVAYAAADGGSIAQEVITHLEAHQFMGWWNKNIPPGSDWDDAIIDAINQADAMILVMTNGARSSRYVRAEWRYALDEQKMPVIPLIMPGFEPSQLPLALREIQWIDARVNFDAALTKLVEALRKIEKR